MKAPRLLASLVAFLLVALQLVGFDFKSFGYEGYTDEVLPAEEQEQDQLQQLQQRQSSRRQNALQVNDFDNSSAKENDNNEHNSSLASRIPDDDDSVPSSSTSTSAITATNTTTISPGDNHPFTCQTTDKGQECCASWDTNSDEWWTQHPEWEISSENETTYCFQPVAGQEKRQFLQQVHELQWGDDDRSCEGLLKSVEQNSGYGAATGWLTMSFFYAYKKLKPFQVAHNQRPWLYSVSDNQRTDKNEWAYCPEIDSRCYYLPISPCNRTETIRDEHYRRKPNGSQEGLQYHWIKQYLYRPKQIFRRKLYEMRSRLSPTIAEGAKCTAMHIRRGDVGFIRPPFRRYAAVQEYLDATPKSVLKPGRGDTILLMTDDESTIQEVQKYHAKNFTWVYLDRPRNRGIEGGFDGHIPSGDPAREMLVINTELTLAKRCQQLVFGQSGFMTNLLNTMALEGRKFGQIHVKTEVDRDETRKQWGKQKEKRVEAMFRDIDGLYAKRGLVPHVLETWKGDLPPPSDLELQHAKSLVTCTGSSADPKQQQCCGTWEVNADAWWLNHPDWEVSMENHTHFCFAPLANETERDFMKEVHAHQWGGNCSEVEKTVVVNSGFGSSINWDLYSFFHAWKRQKQFQLIHGGRVWLYSTKNQSSWAYCESKDSRCYYLPVGRCSRKETIRGEHRDERPKKGERHIFHWLKKYMTRPNQLFRQKTFEMKQLLNMQYPCTTIHVRRGDAGLPVTPFRRYAAVLEYLEKGKVKEGSNVFLMTDDDSTLEEVDRHLKDKYNWMYFKKPRNNGISNGFDGHIPSSDHGLEMLTIASEKELASTCNNVVYGKSGFIVALMDDMERDGKQFTKHLLNTEVTKEEAHKYKGDQQGRVDKFLRDIEDLYQKRAQEAESKNDLPAAKEAPATNPDAANEAEGNITCTTTKGVHECCSTWQKNVDKWWTHHPTWEISVTNDTTQCFQPIVNEEKAAYLQRIYDYQWHGDCKQVLTSTQINSGYSAATNFLAYTFLNATLQQKPFQITEHNFPWLFGPQKKDSWAYCSSEDITCFTLPVSNCKRDYVNKWQLREHNKKNRVWATPNGRNRQEMLEFNWLKQFMLRPTQEMRRQLMLMKLSMNLTTPCTTMHVRRGDSGLPERPYRRYAAVQEYLDAAHVEEGDTILLLTDDQTTIDEINTYHQNYKWVYLNRTRHSGVDGGWESHVPSGDGPFEVLAIETETYLASQCSKVVHGQSGFMKYVLGQMQANGKTVKSFSVTTGVSKDEAMKWPKDGKDRLKHFLEEMEKYRQKSNAKKQLEKNNEIKPRESQVQVSSFDPADIEERKIPLSCSESNDNDECCGSWDIDMDEWWTHHPTWEPSSANQTTQCFQPIQNAEKAAHLQSIYNSQWHGDCEKLITSTQINSGYGASTNWLAYSFFNATLEKKPFQITKHDFPWLFGPKKNHSWAYCESEDITCFTLPLSNCKRDFVSKWKLRVHNLKNRVWTTPNGGNQALHFNWMKQFMLRPTQEMRRQLMLMRLSMNLTSPCTTMHIRRGDSGLPRQPYRRYAAVQEYLDAAKVEEGDTVLLLTDDQTTIDEINTYHQNYNWVYLNRTRHSGVDGGWESHVPSGDGPFEVMAIETESYLASQCSKFVHGKSGFMKHILDMMHAEGKTAKGFFVNTAVSKEEAVKWPMDGKDRFQHFQKEMEEYRKKSNEKKQKKGDKGEQDAAEAAQPEPSVDKGDGDGPLSCIQSTNGIECCGGWDVNVDGWWTHKPTWEISSENSTTQCFSPMKNKEKIEYFQRMYQIQWSGNCSNLISATQVNSGYGAATNWLAHSFLHATTNGNPFQPLLHDRPWKYATQNKDSWAYCDSEDIGCYTLPLSHCKRDFLPRKEVKFHKRKWKTPNRNSEKEKLEFEWLKEFMLRPIQAVRKQLLEMRNTVNLTTPCTTMHVRRGDSGMPREPYRRYASVQEYIDVGEVEEGDTILLLTDDQTTIDEINSYHKDAYHWVYLNRTRTNGVDKGWEDHIPSGDGPFELLAIQTETYLAGLCSKVVHGKSGFMKVVRGIMEAHGKQYKAYVLDTSVSKAEAKKWPWDGKERVAHFQKEMEEYRKKSKERKLPTSKEVKKEK